MRKNASVVITTFVAMTLPLAAHAETVNSNGITYSTGYDSALYQPLAAPADQGYGYQPIVEEFGTAYVTDGEVFQAFDETSMSYQESFNTPYEASVAYEAAEAPADYGQQALMTETIDGIVYETIVGSAIPTVEDVQVIQTY